MSVWNTQFHSNTQIISKKFRDFITETDAISLSSTYSIVRCISTVWQLFCAMRVSFDLRNQVAMVQWKRISFQCHVEERQGTSNPLNTITNVQIKCNERVTLSEKSETEKITKENFFFEKKKSLQTEGIKILRPFWLIPIWMFNITHHMHSTAHKTTHLPTDY